MPLTDEFFELEQLVTLTWKVPSGIDPMCFSLCFLVPYIPCSWLELPIWIFLWIWWRRKVFGEAAEGSFFVPWVCLSSRGSLGIRSEGLKKEEANLACDPGTTRCQHWWGWRVCRGDTSIWGTAGAWEQGMGHGTSTREGSAGWPRVCTGILVTVMLLQCLNITEEAF